MATLAEGFIADANKQNSERENTAALWGQATQVAQFAQAKQQQAAMLKQQQEQLQMAKLEKIGGWYENASKMEDGGAKKAFLNDFIPNGITAMGMQDVFHPTSLKMIGDNPLVVGYASDQIRNGNLKMGDLLGAMANPEKAATLFASPGFKQFGAQQEIKAALQDSLGTVKKSAEFAASEEGKAYRAKLAVDAAAGRQGNALTHQEKMAAARELGDFGNKVLNPSTRAELGSFKQAINLANGLFKLTDPKVPANATVDQRIEAYDKLNTRQIREVVVQLDKILSRSNPTLHGQESLTPPDTPGKFLAKWGEQVGNVPVGTSQGAFVESMLETVRNEKKLNTDKFKQQALALKTMHPNAMAAGYEKRMDDAIEAAGNDPGSTAPPAPGMFKVGGQDMNAVQAKAFYQSHTQFKPDAATAKALGI